MNSFRVQYILLSVILFLTFLGPLLGIVTLFGIQLPIFLLNILAGVSEYTIMLAALLGVFAIYNQIKLRKRIISRRDKVNFIVTSILLLPALYSLVTVILMWSVALMI